VGVTAEQVPSNRLRGVPLTADELSRRPSRPPDHAAENRAILALADVMADSPQAVLDKLVELARDLCRAGSAGVSILEDEGGREVFRWHAIAGSFAVARGGAMPRDSSPCGTVLEQNAIFLFQHPERHFEYPLSVDPPMVEALLAPFHEDGRPVGTVWVIAHTPGHQFDAEDARVLKNLSRFAGTAARSLASQARARVAEKHLRETEERAAFVRRASGVGFWYCDLPFDVLEWDERVTINTFYERIHPDDREPTRRAIDQSIESREGYDTIYRTVHPQTGAERYVRAIGRTFYAADGSPTRFDGVTLDVTAQKRAELAAAEAHRRLDSALIAGEVGTFEWDVAGDRLHGDENFARMFGIELDASGSAPIAGYVVAVHPDDRERVLALVRRTVDTGCDYEAEYRVVTGGQTRWVVARGKGVRQVPDGPVVRFPGVIVDITDRKRAEEALQDADRRKDEFLATLAHELRNPLAPIRNGLQVMRLSGGQSEVIARARDMMDRQLGHMVRLVDDLLDVSRITRGKMELRRERLLLSDVVASAVETVKPAVDEAGHHLTVTVPPEPVHLDGDLTRLAQVLSNLLTNSAKYTPASGQIWLSAERTGGDVVLSVRDTGVGIPAQSQPRIFDMFSQVDRPLERSTCGLGIGLALVKGLVEMHGGSVAVASEGQGRGSTFTVRLPLPPSQPTLEPAAVDAGRAPGGPRRKILVVDDNRDSALSMAEILQMLGHEVATAHDGAEAVDTAETFRPEVVLMDVGMPGMNGFDATRTIRGRVWGKEVTIVALTGWGQEGDRAESQRAGCDGHLVKPIHVKDLEPYLVAPRRA
jgi:PAS domain S-box-containing protein